MSTVREDQQPTPILLCRRRLASELRRLRGTTGLTQKQVSEHLFCDISTVSRMETGKVTVNPRDVRDLLQLYQVNDRLRDDLLQLARDARAKESWWRAYDVPDVRKYVSLEKAAHSISSYESHVLPGLVQVESYARRILSAVFPSIRQDMVEHLVELRVQRRELLRLDGPAALRLVVDEAALRRIPANPAVLRPQVDHLIEVANLAKVTFQIVPFSAGPHPGIAGPFTILEFAAAADPDIVHLEHWAGNAYLDQPEQVDEFRAKFEELQRLAWSTEESMTALLELRHAPRQGNTIHSSLQNC